MLVLERKRDESIRIGDDIIVTVTMIANGRVKIGIDAPRHVAVHREEIYRRILDDEASNSFDWHESSDAVTGAGDK